VLTATQVACVAVGLGLFHAGRGLSHRARHLLHHATEHGGERPLFLATTGVYAGRRHPHAAGLVLTNLGLALGLHSVYVLVLAAIAIAAQLIGARVEERQLSAQFGEKWTDYVASVDRRFFSPVVWVLFVVVYLGAWIGIV
jgi:protein-S-isoprenylcysteine O-methyltransferase Ste14